MNIYLILLLSYLQCSNIFLTKDQDIRLGGCFLITIRVIVFLFVVRFVLVLHLKIGKNIFLWVNAGDFGLAKTLKADDLASSVSSSGHYEFVTKYCLTTMFKSCLLVNACVLLSLLCCNFVNEMGKDSE